MPDSGRLQLIAPDPAPNTVNTADRLAAGVNELPAAAGALAARPEGLQRAAGLAMGTRTPLGHLIAFFPRVNDQDN